MLAKQRLRLRVIVPFLIVTSIVLVLLHSVDIEVGQGTLLIKVPWMIRGSAKNQPRHETDITARRRKGTDSKTGISNLYVLIDE